CRSAVRQSAPLCCADFLHVRWASRLLPCMDCPGTEEVRGMSVPGRLDPPLGTSPVRIDRLNAGALLFYHLVAALAVLPWFFSWTGLAAALVGVYVFGTLGINLCFHRLLTHRGLTCPKWLEYTFAIFGVCSFQDTPARWAAVHRRHHEHSDEQSDPHSPRVG